MTHAEKAQDYFIRGYNCAQAVFAAYCDVTGMEETAALKLSSSFGGGMGRLREVCGALSGIFMVAGALYGNFSCDDTEKREHYTRIQELAEAFRLNHNTILCRELLENLKPDTTPTPSARTEDYYKTRPCLRFVTDACEILDKYIEENP